MVSASIVALYFLPNYIDISVNESPLSIGLASVIMAGLTLVASIGFYIWVPKKNIQLITMVLYLLMLATAAVIISNTGFSMSPFVAFWILLVFFAGAFGAGGLLPIVIVGSVYTAWQYVNNSLDHQELVFIAYSCLVPLITSFVMWHTRSGHEDNSDEKAYKSLESELSEVATKSELIINAIGDGVIAIDSQGVIRLINPAAQNIVGWGKQDALSLNYKSILQMVDINNEPLAAANDPIQQALNINQEIRGNLNMMTNSGKNIMVSLVVSPVGEAGSGVIIVFRDVTREKAEEREQAEFISTASHEMRTPVASIEGYLGLALNPQTAQIDDRAHDYIDKAQASAKHLGRLFQDLLDVSKADDGRISNNPKVVDIVPFAYEIVQGLEPKATEKGLKLTYKPMTGNVREKHITPVYFVNLDNDHIREIINNLVENAIKYTPRGEVIVDIAGSDDHVVISIKDSGIGIPAEDMPHLFQKFYRVDNQNTREIGGTGLGLYLCRRLSEIMGGRIWADSVYGNGSTFYVELPRVSSQEASLLKEQEQFKAQQEAASIAMSQPSQPVSTPTVQTMQPVINATPTNTPRPVTPPQAPSVTQPQTASTPQMQPQQAQPMAAPNPAAQQATAQSKVPRSSSLTPEQIAAYVARQRALAQQQSSASANAGQPVTNRPQNLNVPTREVRQ